jgi:hypothetical protein
MEGYFLTADLLGFGSIVKNSDDGELSSRVANWIELVKRAAAGANLCNRIQLISDTVFVAADSTTDGLASIIRFARELLTSGARSSLPIRGGISHGTFEWGELTYGKAVIEAHQLESRQNWIGVACCPGIPHVDQLWGEDGLVCYTPPLKSGQIQVMPVVVWDVPSFDELWKSLCSNGLVKKGEVLAWPWAEKVTNTVEFENYLYILRGKQGTYEKFHGFLPIQTISANLKGRRPDV